MANDAKTEAIVNNAETESMREDNTYMDNIAGDGFSRNDAAADDKFLKGIYDSQANLELDEPDGLWEAIESSLADTPTAAAVTASENKPDGVSANGAAGTVSGNPRNTSGVATAGTTKVSANKTAASRRSWIYPIVSGLPVAAAVALFYFLGGLRSNTDGLRDEYRGDMINDGIAKVSEQDISNSAVAYADDRTDVDRIAVDDRVVAKSAKNNLVADSDIASAKSASSDSRQSSITGNATVSERSKKSRQHEDFTFYDDESERSAKRKVSSSGYRRENFSFAANASSVGGMRYVSNGYAALSNSDIVRQISEFSAMGKEYSQVLLSNNNSEVSTLTKHFQPIRFSVTAAYRFNRVISIESGLSYTCLVSNLSSGSDKGKYTTRQQLHYIGIPLNLRLEMWSIKNFSLYFSAGGMMEKCVAGKSVTKYAVEGQKSSSASSSLSERQLQWSVNGAFGVQYRFNELVGLYVEPGVSYYFNNGSAIENIYKERPLNFNIALGLRFSL